MTRASRIGWMMLGVIAGVVSGLILIATAGCHAQSAVQRQADLKAQKIKAVATVNDAKGKAQPVVHPIDAAQSTVKEYHAPLLVISIVSGVLFAACVGLLFTPLSAFTKIAVWPLGAVSVLSFFDLIALPFLPWVAGAAGVVALGFFVYEWIRLKSPGAALKAIEADVGIGTSKIAPAIVSTLTSGAQHEVNAINAALHVATPSGMT